MAKWTQERVEKLKTFWEEGLTGGQIEQRFGGVYSRSAILGKVNTLGLSKRKAAKKPDPDPVQDKKLRLYAVRNVTDEKARAMAREKTRAIMDAMAHGGPKPYMVSLVDLEPHMCRWVIGDPGEGENAFGFCGRTKKEGSSYCPHHHARSRTPAQVRRGQGPEPRRKAA